MIDTSKKRQLAGCKHWQSEINQLYHPTGLFKQDSLDIVYNFDDLNITKFTPILLKEWFYLVEVNGYLVIDYRPNKNCDWKKLEAQMWWLWKGKYEIIFHGPVNEEETFNLTRNKIEHYINKIKNEIKQHKDVFIFNYDNKYGRYRFICQKIDPTVYKNDSIDKWTFGIITNGKRKEWLEKIIQSIRVQNIPDYEIIVCGNYFNRDERDFKYIPFYQRDGLGWITKKKNLIIKAAKFENLSIIHDRIYYSENWFKGMKKWGNCFEQLACIQYFGSLRLNDWQLHEKIKQKEYTFTSLLEYRDWDKNVVQSGQLHIFKKSVVATEMWNESYFWKMPEDIRISEDLNNNGFILRMNPYSKMDAFMEKFSGLPNVVYNSQKTPISRKGNQRRILARRLYIILFRLPLLNLILEKMEKYIFK